MIILKLGRDRNGNKVLRVSRRGARGFSVQTLGNLPRVHRNGLDVDYATALSELRAYVAQYGTARQKELLT